MARPEKNTVEYFPHYVNSGKTLYTLEKRYGNDGYAFLFKVLETLGKSENHFIDCRNPADWEFLLAITNVNEVTATEIMELLTKLGTFDEELWSHRIIFCPSFIENIKSVYERRKRKCMQKLDLCKHLQIKCTQKPDSSGINANQSTQSKVKESRVKRSKEDKSIKGISKEILTPSKKARKFFKEIEESKLPDSDEKKKFFYYWTEKNKSGTKERWELEKTFDVGRRWKTWQNNAQKFNQSNYGKNQSTRGRSGHVSTEGHADLVV